MFRRAAKPYDSPRRFNPSEAGADDSGMDIDQPSPNPHGRIADFAINDGPSRKRESMRLCRAAARPNIKLKSQANTLIWALLCRSSLTQRGLCTGTTTMSRSYSTLIDLYPPRYLHYRHSRRTVRQRGKG